MHPREQLAINSILNAVASLDQDADPSINQRNFDAAIQPAVADMVSNDEFNPAYFVMGSTSIIRELIEAIAREQNSSNRDVAEVLAMSTFGFKLSR
jgi:hypothetical protein